jgi:hypothetical protein
MACHKMAQVYDADTRALFYSVSDPSRSQTASLLEENLTSSRGFARASAWQSQRAGMSFNVRLRAGAALPVFTLRDLTACLPPYMPMRKVTLGLANSLTTTLPAKMAGRTGSAGIRKSPRSAQPS